MVISQLELGPVRLQMKEFCVLCLYSWRASHQLHPQRLVNWCSYRPFTTFCTASITIDFPTLNAGQILEYEFPWAKRYRPKASTFSGGKQFLNLEFCFSDFGPRMLFLIVVESTLVEPSARCNEYQTMIRLTTINEYLSNDCCFVSLQLIS